MTKCPNEVGSQIVFVRIICHVSPRFPISFSLLGAVERLVPNLTYHQQQQKRRTTTYQNLLASLPSHQQPDPVTTGALALKAFGFISPESLNAIADAEEQVRTQALSGKNGIGDEENGGEPVVFSRSLSRHAHYFTQRTKSVHSRMDEASGGGMARKEQRSGHFATLARGGGLSHGSMIDIFMTEEEQAARREIEESRKIIEMARTTPSHISKKLDIIR